MAHKGRLFPIKQDWRLYTGNTGSMGQFPPDACLFRTAFWVSTIGAPPVNTWIECNPQPWSAGDYSIQYLSESITVGSHSVRIGMWGEIRIGGYMWWRMSMIEDGVDQIPWGWHDWFSKVNWWPGVVDLIPSDPPAGGSFFPVGFVEIKAKPWP